MDDQQRKSQSWSSYWRQAQPQVSCLPGAPPALGNLLDGIWSSFAKSIDRDSSVVDLACGNGVVGFSMNGVVQSLDIVGIDYAELPISWTPPFPILQESIDKTSLGDDSMDAAVSQFGIEYADTAKVGKELARILKPGGQMQFIMHYDGSVILKANEVREKLLSDAKSSDIWTAANDRDLQKLQSIFDGLLKSHGETPLFLEIASAVRTALNFEEEERKEVLEALQTSMAGELDIIASLKSAAIGPSELDKWTKKLGKHFHFDDPKVIRIGDDTICWNLTGSHQP